MIFFSSLAFLHCVYLCALCPCLIFSLTVRKTSSGHHHHHPGSPQSPVIPSLDPPHQPQSSTTHHTLHHSPPNHANTSSNSLSHPSSSKLDPRHSNGSGPGGGILFISPHDLTNNNNSAGSSPATTASSHSRHNIEPTDMGIIPPEFRNATAVSSSVPQSNAAASTTSSPPSRSPPEQQLQQPSETSSSKNGANQAWSANPVEEWAKEQVCQWLLALGMESYITLFMDKTITGAALLNFDSNGLKELGIKSKEDREKIKKKIKELKAHNDKECKRDGHKKENFLKKAFNKK
eukprot:TRINITY_DN735_c0_g1_i8.p1 TRINITY_DN735_c0_g1~~TRINITY_DN735_c0_g1_i8.p1  ORF type:complete len:291 (+),score=74.59 TRINITY_DN735_c0_g1_i8:178-1050(+)